jgi:hypothetical protein
MDMRQKSWKMPTVSAVHNSQLTHFRAQFEFHDVHVPPLRLALQIRLFISAFPWGAIKGPSVQQVHCYGNMTIWTQQGSSSLENCFLAQKYQFCMVLYPVKSAFSKQTIVFFKRKCHQQGRGKYL